MLLSIRGTAGTIAVVPAEQDGANITQDTARVRVRPEVDRTFIEKVLCTYAVQHYIRFHTVGQAVRGINIRDVRRIPVALPERAEQARIGALLHGFDRAVSNLVSLIESKRRFKHGLMQEVLTGKRRFGEMKSQEWRQLPLSHWFEEFSRRNPSGEVPEVLSCTKKGIVRQRDRFSKRLASTDLSRYKVVSQGDLVYDPMLLWDGSFGFVEIPEGGVVSPAYATLRYKGSEDDRAFLRQLLASAHHRHQYKVISQGTNQRRRKAIPSDYLRIAGPVPLAAMERARIGHVADLLEKEVQSLQRLLELLRQQSSAVAELLLTGQVRVPEAAS